MERITAKDFDNQRSALIRLHEENPGKRGYGEDTTDGDGVPFDFSEVEEVEGEESEGGCLAPSFYGKTE